MSASKKKFPNKLKTLQIGNSRKMPRVTFNNYDLFCKTNFHIITKLANNEQNFSLLYEVLRLRLVHRAMQKIDTGGLIFLLTMENKIFKKVLGYFQHLIFI